MPSEYLVLVSSLFLLTWPGSFWQPKRTSSMLLPLWAHCCSRVCKLIPPQYTSWLPCLGVTQPVPFTLLEAEPVYHISLVSTGSQDTVLHTSPRKEHMWVFSKGTPVTFPNRLPSTNSLQGRFGGRNTLKLLTPSLMFNFKRLLRDSMSIGNTLLFFIFQKK